MGYSFPPLHNCGKVSASGRGALLQPGLTDHRVPPETPPATPPQWSQSTPNLPVMRRGLCKSDRLRKIHSDTRAGRWLRCGPWRAWPPAREPISVPAARRGSELSRDPASGFRRHHLRVRPWAGARRRPSPSPRVPGKEATPPPYAQLRPCHGENQQQAGPRGAGGPGSEHRVQRAGAEAVVQGLSEGLSQRHPQPGGVPAALHKVLPLRRRLQVCAARFPHLRQERRRHHRFPGVHLCPFGHFPRQLRAETQLGL